jgi:hypothetical protein
MKTELNAQTKQIRLLPLVLIQIINTNNGKFCFDKMEIICRINR